MFLPLDRNITQLSINVSESIGEELGNRNSGMVVKFYLSVLLLMAGLDVSADTIKNGFVLDGPLVHEKEILHGGPSKDGIPAIDKPIFIKGRESKAMVANERVLGITFNGVTKAYPIKILNFHEIVNDTFARHPVVISYCPLCGTGMAFDALIKGQTYLFGVSGLLYNSDLLMYDRTTESLWSQIEGLAINGAMKTYTLERLIVEHTTWADWLNRFPETLVLSRDTGFWRDYDATPYPGYENSEHLYFPVANVDRRYHPKESVLGIEIKGKAKVYPFTELSKLSSSKKSKNVAGRMILNDTFDGKDVQISFNLESRTAVIKDESGKLMPSLIGYWFAWMAFYPKSEIYTFDD